MYEHASDVGTSMNAYSILILILVPKAAKVRLLDGLPVHLTCKPVFS